MSIAAVTGELVNGGIWNRLTNSPDFGWGGQPDPHTVRQISYDIGAKDDTSLDISQLVLGNFCFDIGALASFEDTALWYVIPEQGTYALHL